MQTQTSQQTAARFAPATFTDEPPRRLFTLRAFAERHASFLTLAAVTNQVFKDKDRESTKGNRPAGDFNDLAQAEGPDVVRRQILEELAPNSRYRPTDADEFANQPPLEWLVKGLIPRRGVATIYGPSGCGKSFLTLDLLAAIAAGREWFDFRTTAAPVRYVCLEGSAGFGKRLKAYLEKVGPLDGFKILADSFNLNRPQDVADLIAAVKAHALTDGVVCVDTLAAATPGMDENSAESMTAAIAVCQRIQAEVSGLVLLVHHTGKDTSKGPRGSSALTGAMDASLSLSGGDGEPRQWVAAKVKDDGKGEPHYFDLVRVVLDHDDDGDEITSCFVQPSNPYGDASEGTLPFIRVSWGSLLWRVAVQGAFRLPGSTTVFRCFLTVGRDSLRSRAIALMLSPSTK